MKGDGGLVVSLDEEGLVLRRVSGVIELPCYWRCFGEDGGWR